jgi:hypothetical protein
MASIGIMARSGEMNIRSVRFFCDNEAAVKRCNQKQTKSAFHNTEGDMDLVSTYRDLKKHWCDSIYVCQVGQRPCGSRRETSDKI